MVESIPPLKRTATLAWPGEDLIMSTITFLFRLAVGRPYEFWGISLTRRKTLRSREESRLSTEEASFGGIVDNVLIIDQS